MRGEILERTSLAMAAEVRRSRWRGRPAKTIFFGGGTPTFFSEAQLLRIVEAVLEAHPPIEGCEITSEANPGTVDMPKFRAMRRAGFNRISLGAQSFADDELLRLERVHKADEIVRAVGSAREAGYENLNLDLMFALPGQSLARWEANLERAIALRPEHLSLYCLTLEPNTKFYKEHLRGALVVPDDEAQVAMYDASVALAEGSGYGQYEISNFAKPGFECRHNLCYWRGEEYLGYGPGAVGAVNFGLRIADFGLAVEANTAGWLPDGAGRTADHSTSAVRHPHSRTRYTNLKHPERYCAAVEASSALWCESEPLDESTLRLERIMLGIRLNEGLALDQVPIPQSAIRNPQSKGWVTLDGNHIRLTPAGRHWCSEVALALA